MTQPSNHPHSNHRLTTSEAGYLRWNTDLTALLDLKGPFTRAEALEIDECTLGDFKKLRSYDLIEVVNRDYANEYRLSPRLRERLEYYQRLSP